MISPPKLNVAEILAELNGADHRGCLQTIVDCCQVAKGAARRIDANFLVYLLDMASQEALGQVEKTGTARVEKTGTARSAKSEV